MLKVVIDTTTFDANYSQLRCVLSTMCSLSKDVAELRESMRRLQIERLRLKAGDTDDNVGDDGAPINVLIKTSEEEVKNLNDSIETKRTAIAQYIDQLVADNDFMSDLRAMQFDTIPAEIYTLEDSEFTNDLFLDFKLFKIAIPLRELQSGLLPFETSDEG